MVVVWYGIEYNKSTEIMNLVFRCGFEIFSIKNPPTNNPKEIKHYDGTTTYYTAYGTIKYYLLLALSLSVPLENNLLRFRLSPVFLCCFPFFL